MEYPHILTWLETHPHHAGAVRSLTLERRGDSISRSPSFLDAPTLLGIVSALPQMTTLRLVGLKWHCESSVHTAAPSATPSLQNVFLCDMSETGFAHLLNMLPDRLAQLYIRNITCVLFDIIYGRIN